MKGGRIFGCLTAAVVLAQWLLTISATPVLAASVTIYPQYGPVNNPVTVSGAGFTANNPYTITFAYGTSFALGVGRGIVNNNGEIPPTSFNVPGIPGGSYTIRVETFGETAEHVSRVFLIVPEISLDQSYGRVGSQVTVDGTGFAAVKTVAIYFDDEVTATAKTDANGRFIDAAFVVPENSNGSHTVRAADELNNYATDSYSTRESLTIAPTSGTPGDKITVNGTGFRSNRSIITTFDKAVVSATSPECWSNDRGSFSDVFAVPSRPNGIYEIEVSDSSNRVTASFTIVSGVSLSSTTGIIGTKLTLTGSGFSGPVTVKYDEATVSTAPADYRGEFSATFDVPSSKPGVHTITASDGVNTKTVTFVMESMAPPVPTLLSPPADTQVEPTARIDWDDIKDYSLPVTYALQITADSNFSSVVLERTGLSKSEYTITEAERLKPKGRSAPYYWRVKAVDSAANESGWSTTLSFYVGSTFSLANWGLYILIGLAAILLGFIGFALGRRTSYR